VRAIMLWPKLVLPQWAVVWASRFGGRNAGRTRVVVVPMTPLALGGCQTKNRGPRRKTDAPKALLPQAANPSHNHKKGRLSW
jgi:hypothetical protein